ncbi:MAG: hypothetical protein AAGA29_02980 [Planctomycetota bacterium]
MTRVLHLLTDEPGTPSAALAALVADVIQQEPGEHHALLRGGEMLRDAAKAAGLKPFTLLPDRQTPWPGLLPCTLRQGRLITQCDRVDAWTPRAAKLARQAGAPAVQPRFHPANLARLAEQCTDTDRLETCDREAMRRRWGLADNDHAVAMIGRTLGDADTALAALAGVMVQGILDARGKEAGRLALICHPQHPRRREAQRMLDSADHASLLIQEPKLDQPWRTYPACDAALVTAPSARPTLHAYWATQAGLHIHTTTGRPSDLAQAISEHLDAQRGASVAVCVE